MIGRAMELRNTKTTILNQGGSEEKREEIRQYFHATYTLDESFMKPWRGKKPSTSAPSPCGTR